MCLYLGNPQLRDGFQEVGHLRVVAMTIPFGLGWAQGDWFYTDLTEAGMTNSRLLKHGQQQIP